MNTEKLPRHIAIIMDGNGRWARRRSLPRLEGHRCGSENVDEIVTACRELGVPYLTLYAFSMENWSRPKEEVDALMVLLGEFLVTKRKKLVGNRIRLETIGDIGRLPETVLSVLEETKKLTASFDRMTLILALSYGARDEITRAVNKILKSGADSISADRFGEYLDTHFLPDPDLVIRTSGESRISNFLLWQVAYSEIVITDTLWPDFHRKDLIKAIAEYQKRERRFGQTSDQLMER